MGDNNESSDLHRYPEIEIQEVAYEKTEPFHVIIDTKCTGICGSDLHNYFGNWEPSAAFQNSGR